MVQGSAGVGLMRAQPQHIYTCIWGGTGISPWEHISFQGVGFRARTLKPNRVILEDHHVTVHLCVASQSQPSNSSFTAHGMHIDMCMFSFYRICPMVIPILSVFLCVSALSVRYEADNWNKFRNMCAKQIGIKIKHKEPVGGDAGLSMGVLDKLYVQSITVEDLMVS